MTETTQNPPPNLHEAAPEAPPEITALDRAARSLAACNHPFHHKVSMGAMRDELLHVYAADGDGRSLMALQAQVLDSLFNRMIVAGLPTRDLSGKPLRKAQITIMDDLHLALRAQRQCMRTLDVLSRVEMRQKFASELDKCKKSE